MSHVSRSPFTALVDPAVVEAAAQRAERLDLPRRTCKAWSNAGRDEDEELEDEELEDEELDDGPE